MSKALGKFSSWASRERKSHTESKKHGNRLAAGISNGVIEFGNTDYPVSRYDVLADGRSAKKKQR